MPATRKSTASSRQSASKASAARSARGKAARKSGPATRSRSKSGGATGKRPASRSRPGAADRSRASSRSSTSRSGRRARRVESTSGSDRSQSRSPSPARPKRAMTAYMAFIQAHMKNSKLDRGAFGARTKELAAQWKNMTAEQKAEYQARADQANTNRPNRATRRRR